MYETSEDRFLSQMVGSGWGCWRVRYNWHNDTFTISRHEEGKKRVYVDPDRRYMFKRMKDGSYEVTHGEQQGR